MYVYLEIKESIEQIKTIENIEYIHIIENKQNIDLILAEDLRIKLTE